jgi:hypothetical protein
MKDSHWREGKPTSGAFRPGLDDPDYHHMSVFSSDHMTPLQEVGFLFYFVPQLQLPSNSMIFLNEDPPRDPSQKGHCLMCYAHTNLLCATNKKLLCTKSMLNRLLVENSELMKQKAKEFINPASVYPSPASPSLAASSSSSSSTTGRTNTPPEAGAPAEAGLQEDCMQQWNTCLSKNISVGALADGSNNNIWKLVQHLVQNNVTPDMVRDNADAHAKLVGDEDLRPYIALVNMVQRPIEASI